MTPVSQFPAPDPLLRFSIAPDASGGWRWEVRGPAQAPLAGGVVATRKIAAALVINHIVQARTRSAAAPAPTAKAA